MTRPRTVEQLYLTDGEIAARVGLTAEEWTAATKALRGLPPTDPVFKFRRYWPAVRAYLDRRAGLVETPPPDGEERFDLDRPKPKWGEVARQRFGIARADEIDQPDASITMKKPKRGYVYFIVCGEYVKIGFSEDPVIRLGGLKTGNPFELTIAHIIRNVPPSEERAMQKLFDKHHHRDEWFRIEGSLKSWLEAQIR